MDYVVIDTEGKPELSELAIIDSQGRVIYEGFSSDCANNGSHLPNLKSLKNLLLEFSDIVKGKKIICHYAKHDIEVLKFSFHKAGLKVPPLEFDCTCIRAKNSWLGLESYSLEYLSKYLNLRANNRYFIRDMAHSARYDAEFTYYLYLKLMISQLKEQPNPFSSSRVDTPFQNHPDDFDTYHQQFITLESILKNIELDSNRQSKGAVVIGEPGSGKTHLMMRLAQARLSSNRLLFIRQPNNSSSVLHHIYSRILESLVEQVGSFTQLDYLIISSFDKIVANLSNLTKKDQEIIKALKDDNKNALWGEESYNKLVYWQQIQKRINEWWVKHYSAGGFALSILKGIIKYCSYSDYNYKNIATRWLAGQALSKEEAEKVGLPNWQENFSLEEFSLEAISVLGKLSILDQPLIIIFDQLEGLALPQNREILHQFGETIKEIFTHVPNSLIILNMFPDRWEHFKDTFDNSIIGRVSQYQIQLQRPQENELLSILKVKLQTINIPLEKIFLAEDLEDILEQKSVRAVLNRAAEYYNYRVCQIPLPSIKENVRKLEGNEKIEQQLRELTSGQQKFTKIFVNIIQEMQDPGSIDMRKLLQELGISEGKDGGDPIKKYVIEYLTKQKAYLEAQYHKLPIISDSDDIGKLKTIAEAFNHIKPTKLTFYRLGKWVLPEHIVIETERQNYVLGFLQMSPNTAFTSRISNFNELVCLHPKDSFSLFRDERLTEIKGAVAKEKISQLNNSHNGKFIFFSKPDRIHLELTYKLIIDVQNRDLDVDLESALKVFITKPEWYHWLFNMFGFTEPTA